MLRSDIDSVFSQPGHLKVAWSSSRPGNHCQVTNTFSAEPLLVGRGAPAGLLSFDKRVAGQPASRVRGSTALAHHVNAGPCTRWLAMP